jgi:hypothetical protein
VHSHPRAARGKAALLHISRGRAGTSGSLHAFPTIVAYRGEARDPAIELLPGDLVEYSIVLPGSDPFMIPTTGKWVRPDKLRLRAADVVLTARAPVQFPVPAPPAAPTTAVPAAHAAATPRLRAMSEPDHHKAARKRPPEMVDRSTLAAPAPARPPGEGVPPLITKKQAAAAPPDFFTTTADNNNSGSGDGAPIGGSHIWPASEGVRPPSSLPLPLPLPAHPSPETRGPLLSALPAGFGGGLLQPTAVAVAAALRSAGAGHHRPHLHHPQPPADGKKHN